MFNKITCKKCSKKVNKKNSFCPNCGNYLSPYKKTEEKKSDWGMLGKDDRNSEEINRPENSLFGNFGEKMLSKMINQTMKMLEKEMQKDMGGKIQPQKNPPQGNFTRVELFVNGKRVDPRNIKVTQKPVVVSKKPIEQKSKFLSNENTKKFSSLPKKEPETNLRRLENKIIYEIELPGVKDIEDISIIRLENGLEIKAISKDAAYKKTIPINLNVSNYSLSNEKLVLELIE